MRRGSRRYLPLVLCAIFGPACARAETTLYVSPQGRDVWSGRPAAANKPRTDGPFATITRARDEVRRLRRSGGLTGGVRVLLRGGVYRVSSPIAFGPEDSGAASAPVRYAAYPGERPIVSGGRPIRGWKRGADGVWRASVPGASGRRWVFRQLWANGRRLTPARSPNAGWFMTSGKAGPAAGPDGKPVDRANTAFRFQPGSLRNWSRIGDVEVKVFHIWETSILPVRTVDEGRRTVTFAGPSKWAFEWCGRQRYIVENHPGTLDVPGEWQLDRESGVVSLIPPQGLDPRNAEIVAPQPGPLVTLTGEPDSGRLVEHLTFEGIAFQHSDWPLPPEGHGDWQAAVTVPAAVQAVGARACRFIRCEIAHVGGYGVSLGRGCRGNTVQQCHLHDLGAGGVKIGETSPADGSAAAFGNFVDNCYIHNGGLIHCGAIGVWVGQSSDNRISHNEICDMNYTGISVGWSWGFAPTTCHRNRIEYNHLHHLGQRTMSDMGAIYTLGISTGTVIRNNLIHEIWGHEQSGSGGIYPDEGTSGVLVENNVVAGTIYGGFSIHYGRDITARNNIFALSRDRQISRGRADMKTTFSFERNIVLYDGGELMGGSGAITSSGSNVYWCTSAPVRFPDGATLAQWQAQGYERDSVVADPLFADPRRLDFRLKPGSPALKLGFQPIDTRACGLYGPKAWTSLPRAVKRPAFAYPAKPAPRPLLLNEGFEQQDPGTSADQAVTWGEAGEARVRVTDEAAASGRQSLKFADAAGLDYPFNPHIWYVPNLEQGLVALDFDVRLESGAVACVEWRDAASPYNVGPSIVIDGSGELTAAGRAITRLSPGTWSHVRMVAGLGARAAATWRLEVRPAGGSAQVVEGLPCGRGFKKLQWLGFVSNATTAAVYYVDNVQLQTLKR